MLNLHTRLDQHPESLVATCHIPGNHWLWLAPNDALLASNVSIHATTRRGALTRVQLNATIPARRLRDVPHGGRRMALDIDPHRIITAHVQWIARNTVLSNAAFADLFSDQHDWHARLTHQDDDSTYTLTDLSNYIPARCTPVTFTDGRARYGVR